MSAVDSAPTWRDFLGHLGHLAVSGGIRSSSGTRRDNWPMAAVGTRNERLAKAISDRGLTPAAFARQIDVTPKTVERWLAGALPYKKSRAAAAAALGQHEAELFAGADRVVEAAIGEIVEAWPRRADCPPQRWRQLLQGADEQIAILGYAVLHLTEQHPDFVDALVAKAAAGCSVRVVVASPTAASTVARDQEEGLEGGLVARIRSSLKYLRPLRDSAVQLRLQQAPMYNSVFRYDDDMRACQGFCVRGDPCVVGFG